MHIDSSKGKYRRHLLRETYREAGKVKHRTLANLSRCSDEEIAAMRLALRHKKDLTSLISIKESLTTKQGLSVGAVWLVYDIARQLGIVDALGYSVDGKLALWQVIARVIDQGSRLSAVRLAGTHAACDIIGLGAFNEDKLYRNLGWLCNNQSRIENYLFKKLHPVENPGLFLYDVTSSYLEGECNELAAFGYNRDGKKGKRQIVIGLLCDAQGNPLSIEVFTGNTPDQSTFFSQVKKVAKRFGGGEVTFVGDRGMIKSTQVEDLAAHSFHYITAITKPQIEALLVKGVFQMSLFDQELAEVESNDGIRYILRRNPVRAQEIQFSREDKFRALQNEVLAQNQYLAEHSRASIEVAFRDADKRCAQLKLDGYVTLAVEGRKIFLSVNETALEEIIKLDGCYVLKTDLEKEIISKENVHARYKDLALVEKAFRIIKTVELEMRPVNVRLANNTRGHALVVMLAYRIVKELSERWRDIDATIQEGIDELTSLCATETVIDGGSRCNSIPEPRSSIKKLLSAARVRLPEVLPCTGVCVTTRKKLSKNRKARKK